MPTKIHSGTTRRAHRARTTIDAEGCSLSPRRRSGERVRERTPRRFDALCAPEPGWGRLVPISRKPVVSAGDEPSPPRFRGRGIPRCGFCMHEPLLTNLGSPVTSRRFPLSPSEGERAGVGSVLALRLRDARRVTMSGSSLPARPSRSLVVGPDCNRLFPRAISQRR